MLTNLIQPQQISGQTIRNEIAKAARIAVEKIQKFECWPHQIWVHITGVGGRILSYRSLPTYIHQGILAVKNCQTLEQLEELGQIFKLENQRFPQYYTDEYLHKLREAWAEKRDDLREKEKREAPIKKHQQDGQQWLECWQGVIANCRSVPFLQSLYPNMEDQSQRFADLPEIMDQLLNCYRKKWEKLGGF